MIKRCVLIFFLSVILIFQVNFASSIKPFGADVEPGVSGSAPSSPAGSHEAIAGNVTELNIFGYSTTQTWQGYYGNVTGVIQLADANDKVMYNWTLASPQGEVYASTNSTINWINIQCFNYTATGTYDNEAGNGGTTNLYGTNLTILEEMFGLNTSSVDGVDETFNLKGVGTHNRFYTAQQEFSEGECWSTRLFDVSGKGVDNLFENVLLYEPTTASVIFTALLNKDVAGFDGATHDFEMLVLENGRGTDVATTRYYFFVELE